MTVGEKIKYFRTMHGFTQEQLVQATGLSISTLQKYESDERKPKPEQLLKISQALGIVSIFLWILIFIQFPICSHLYLK